MNGISVYFLNITFKKWMWPTIVVAVTAQFLIDFIYQFDEGNNTLNLISFILVIGFVNAFFAFLYFSHKLYMATKKEIEQKSLSQEELHQIIKSLDEGIIIQKFQGREPTNDPEQTQYFTNGFLDAIYRFALDDAPT